MQTNFIVAHGFSGKRRSRPTVSYRAIRIDGAPVKASLLRPLRRQGRIVIWRRPIDSPEVRPCRRQGAKRVLLGGLAFGRLARSAIPSLDRLAPRPHRLPQTPLNPVSPASLERGRISRPRVAKSRKSPSSGRICVPRDAYPATHMKCRRTIPIQSSLDSRNPSSETIIVSSKLHF